MTATPTTALRPTAAATDALREHARVDALWMTAPSNRTDETRAIVRQAERDFDRWLERTGARPSQARSLCGHGLIRRTCPHLGLRVGLCTIPGLDHASFWNLPDGRRVVVHHPYSLPDAEEVAAFDAAWGTWTVIQPGSWYNPGATLQVEVYGPEVVA